MRLVLYPALFASHRNLRRKISGKAQFRVVLTMKDSKFEFLGKFEVRRI